MTNGNAAWRIICRYNLRLAKSSANIDNWTSRNLRAHIGVHYGQPSCVAASSDPQLFSIHPYVARPSDSNRRGDALRPLTFYSDHRWIVLWSAGASSDPGIATERGQCPLDGKRLCLVAIAVNRWTNNSFLCRFITPLLLELKFGKVSCAKKPQSLTDLVNWSRPPDVCRKPSSSAALSFVLFDTQTAEQHPVRTYYLRFDHRWTRKIHSYMSH